MVGVASGQHLFLKHGMEKGELRETEASRASSVFRFGKGNQRGWFFLLGAGIKAQICSLVELLATTLKQAHALFYTLPEGLLPDPALPCGLLFSTLETITGQHPAGELLAKLFKFWFTQLIICSASTVCQPPC